jgi:hypothetical protein
MPYNTSMLNDHETRELVNRVNRNLHDYLKLYLKETDLKVPDCLREIIRSSVVNYLDGIKNEKNWFVNY